MIYSICYLLETVSCIVIDPIMNIGWVRAVIMTENYFLEYSWNVGGGLVYLGTRFDTRGNSSSLRQDWRWDYVSSSKQNMFNGQSCNFWDDMTFKDLSVHVHITFWLVHPGKSGIWWNCCCPRCQWVEMDPNHWVIAFFNVIC